MSGHGTFLLDTHVWIWLATDSDRIPERVLPDLTHPDSTLLLSAASSWEIAIKYRLGKLPMPSDPATYVPDRCVVLGITPLAVEHSHALRVAQLSPVHGDPFDRLIVAQAQILDVPIVTADPRIRQYDVATVDV